MNRLFMICPTDYLETTLNRMYGGSNYFFTSLGNSVELNDITIWEIEKLLGKRAIEEVVIVLKKDNKIISDSVYNSKFRDIKGISNLYSEVKGYKPYATRFDQKKNDFNLYISYLLNKKVMSLVKKLESNYPDLTINSFIYDPKNRTLSHTIHPILSNKMLTLN